MALFYEFLTGPMMWITVVVCLGGLAVRIAFMWGISRNRDKYYLDHFDWGWSLRSIFHWLIPLGSQSLRERPLFGIAAWLFHVGLIITPIFLSAHNLIFQEAFGWRLPTLPDGVADVLTVVVIISGLVLLIRRVVLPEVRILTGGWDWFLLLLTLCPFVTGFVAYHQLGGAYGTWLIVHIISSQLLLILIPFTKLSHVVLFFLTRSAVGSELGARREEHGRLGVPAW